MQVNVQIVLATYNGELFLQQQIESLLQQTYSDFTILIRDDGSTDKTLDILQTYQEKYPSKFIFLNDEKKNVGATQNFGILLSHSTANYIFFCDQDDVWMPNKVALSLNKLKELESGNTAIPCMIYSDMQSIDERGNVIAHSVWQQLKLSPKCFILNRLLIQNIPHGCTMGINKAMRDIAVPIPSSAILHDHWIALLSSMFGKHFAFEQTLVQLRNHASNVTRKRTSFQDKWKRYSSNLFDKTTYEYFIKIRVAQAKAVLQRTCSMATATQKELLNEFVQLENEKGWTRKKILLKNKFYRNTFWHTLKMILRA
jgi:glycosyltransferase involved in cell wall biosynthesis